MRHDILAISVAAGLLLASCAATMRVQATAPTLDNAAACGASPALGPTPASSVFAVTFSWTGPTSGTKTISGLAPGSLAQISETVPPGTYTVRAFVTDQAGNVGCDSSIVATFKSPPHKVGGLGTYTP